MFSLKKAVVLAGASFRHEQSDISTLGSGHVGFVTETSAARIQRRRLKTDGGSTFRSQFALFDGVKEYDDFGPGVTEAELAEIEAVAESEAGVRNYTPVASDSNDWQEAADMLRNLDRPLVSGQGVGAPYARGQHRDRRIFPLIKNAAEHYSLKMNHVYKVNVDPGWVGGIEEEHEQACSCSRGTPSVERSTWVHGTRGKLPTHENLQFGFQAAAITKMYGEGKYVSRQDLGGYARRSIDSSQRTLFLVDVLHCAFRVQRGPPDDVGPESEPPLGVVQMNEHVRHDNWVVNRRSVIPRYFIDFEITRNHSEKENQDPNEIDMEGSEFTRNDSEKENQDPTWVRRQIDAYEALMAGSMADPQYDDALDIDSI